MTDAETIEQDGPGVPPLREGREDKGGRNTRFRIVERPPPPAPLRPSPDRLVRLRILPPADEPPGQPVD